MSNLSNRKLATKARDAVNALAAFAAELHGPDYDPADVAFTLKVKDLFADLAAAPQPRTYTAAEAWEKMEDGYRVDIVGGGDNPEGVWYMDGQGAVCLVCSHDVFCQTQDRWVDAHRYTLHDIHPDAHKHALQRHLAAGMKVGSRVEVVDVDGGESLLRAGVPSHHAGETLVVEEICDGDDYMNVTAGGWSYPAHCLRLIEAEPYTPPCDAPDGFEWVGREAVPELFEWYWSEMLSKPLSCSHAGSDPRHILRKLPPPKPEDQVPPATETAEGGGRGRFVLGDRVLVEGVVTRDDDINRVRVMFDAAGSEVLNELYMDPSGLRSAGDG